ncbi:MAG: SRPBCC family protein [Litoreibacter sp.]|uniref:SRPBCC family protein n=1 Tax=Litoreibacter sp. TaxID=1969459 RepID=UPI003296C012
MLRIFKTSAIIAHGGAAAASLYYAWLVSQSAYVKTGLQFITPLLIILMAHLCWIAATRGFAQGFARVAFSRTAQTSIGMAAILLLGSFIAPQPATASALDAVAGLISGMLGVMFCVAIVVGVASILAAIGYVLFKGGAAVVNALSRGDRDGPDSRLFDFGSVGLATAALCVCSLEGLPNSYAFGVANEGVASRFVDASPAKVWDAMGVATSPSFPLPDILQVFPQPVGVVIDEGVGLGAMRKVKIAGREGTGYLTLQVVERTQTTAVFKVLSDTSPIGRWVQHQYLTYSVVPDGEGTRLSVSLEYDRLLAPSWFFTPLTKGAAHLAMDVLARDVATRAEG